MRWLLDTNVWIDSHAGRADACRFFAMARATPNAWIGFSALTALEVLGYSSLTTADDIALRAMLAEFEAVAVESAVIEEAIRIRKAHRLKSPDAIIAATALLQHAELVTRNTTDFKRITGLSVLDTQSF
jgi:predicted nucleic acid-binding protein